MRPKVEMPEYTASACIVVGLIPSSQLNRTGTDLGSTISRQSVVPQALVWTTDWLLVVITMSSNSRDQCKTQAQDLHLSVKEHLNGSTLMGQEEIDMEGAIDLPGFD